MEQEKKATRGLTATVRFTDTDIFRELVAIVMKHCQTNDELFQDIEQWLQAMADEQN